MKQPPNVLVAGAGPAGLTLALQAHDHGARVRIVERRPEAFRPSRALLLHPRTLEVLRPLGVTDELLAHADIAPRAVLHLGKRKIGVGIGDLSMPDSAFPLLSLVRQTDVETVLAAALASRGIEIERGVELVDLEDGDRAVAATLRSPFARETAEFDYVAGCDGQESAVRRAADIEWRGAGYAEEVVLADVELSEGLEQGLAHVVTRRAGLMFAFSLGESATWRLLVTRRASGRTPPFGQPGSPASQGELQSMLDDAGLGVQITRLTWSASYRLQHRIASHFRKGRLFLAGDAAHAHSPATGQGMNTSIQDAANLGWKLAFAPFATNSEALLVSYGIERRPLARRLLAITHLVFWAEASTHPLPSFVRSRLMPLAAPLIPWASEQHWLVAEMLRQMTQWRCGYRRSPISRDDSPPYRGQPAPGQRLPDRVVVAGDRSTCLHGLTAQPGVHVLLSSEAGAIESDAYGQHVKLHRLVSSPGTGVVAVRPDGYVGYRSGVARAAQLRSWLESIGAVAEA